MKRWLPNTFSALRLVLIVPFVWIFFRNPRIDAFILAVMIMCTDAIDGALARKLHAESRTGAVLDSVADSLFVLSSWIVLYISDEISLTFFVLLFVPRLIVIIPRIIQRVRNGAWGVEHSIGDKIGGATNYAIILVLLYYPPLSFAAPLASLLLITNGAAALYSIRERI